MPSFLASVAALAVVGVVVANPVDKRFSPDSCLAAVTGKAALGDDNLRKEHCSSFFKTIVTPAAITVTKTITDAPEPSNWNQWEKKDVTVCPNEVPNYASACDENGYRSACNAWGVTYETTFTIPATTYTKTVYVATGKGSVCPSSTATVTVTVTAGHPSATPSGWNPPYGVPGLCLTAEKAKEFTDAFKDLLEYTNAGTDASNSPYHPAVSAKYLAVDFKDYSDSINWMSHRPLGGVTFSSRAQFDQEQGSQQPLIVADQLTNFGCKHITWKWNAITATGAHVMGINHMILTDDLSQIKENHAEFDNAAWIDSFKNIPGLPPPAINCQTPNLSGGSSGGNSTAPAGKRGFSL